jgi:hypothetical protein
MKNHKNSAYVLTKANAPQHPFKYNCCESLM